jgi:hypothetical protein
MKWAKERIDEVISSIPCEVECANHEVAMQLRYTLYKAIPAAQRKNMTFRVKGRVLKISKFEEPVFEIKTA